VSIVRRPTVSRKRSGADGAGQRNGVMISRLDRLHRQPRDLIEVGTA
jgi:hypothetical protein